MSLFQRLGKLIKTYRVSTVLDVGAHVGDFSAGLRSISGFEGPIIAFEPLSEAFHRLLERARGDELLQCHQVALGAQNGSATLNVTRNLYSSSLLRPRHQAVAIEPGVEVVRREAVNIRRLDDLAREFGLVSERLLLKMDVQGFEHEVLKGAPEVLDSVVLLMAELSFFGTYEGGWTLVDALPDLYRRGFRIVGCEEGWANDATGEVLEGDFLFARGPEPS